VLGVRYAVERRRQRQANARALSFMMDEAFEAPAVLEVR
jgi:hypothetical protein